MFSGSVEFVESEKNIEACLCSFQKKIIGLLQNIDKFFAFYRADKMLRSRKID